MFERKDYMLGVDMFPYLVEKKTLKNGIKREKNYVVTKSECIALLLLDTSLEATLQPLSLLHSEQLLVTSLDISEPRNYYIDSYLHSFRAPAYGTSPETYELRGYSI